MPVTLTVNIIIELIKYYKKHAQKNIDKTRKKELKINGSIMTMIE